MNKLFVFSGAGLSQPSGISTFRDVNGLWENHNVNQIANLFFWEDNKSLVFEFYNQRRLQLNDVSPNAAHYTLGELEELLGPDRFVHFTQNVDDLGERARGKNIIHVHGNLEKMECLDCKYNWDIGYTRIDPHTSYCPKCLSQKIKPGVVFSKPGVVFFNQVAPNYHRMIQEFSTVKAGDVILVIGTPGYVVPMRWVTGEEKKTYNMLFNTDLGNLSRKTFDVWESESVDKSLPEFKELILDMLNKKLDKE